MRRGGRGAPGSRGDAIVDIGTGESGGLGGSCEGDKVICGDEDGGWKMEDG